ncbi:autotransporter domain-containing protein [Nitratireductor basaltis]|uniref:Outer membrane autotransporter barrel domain-containing protein n=1 Tax=Nitratireductor basaltis TaxID=472175 RepID=A0A084UBZ7_9HYPH|nr:autotransporter domain-containing protein [Nitratireductor basaltis]KFB10483.1 Outer membrane autotransporter barrel domain-containing protein [Nitratireductor basaltis]
MMRGIRSGCGTSAIALVAAAGGTLLAASPATAACGPTAGTSDTYVCDSGTMAGGLTDTVGDNSLTFPDGGNGTIDGDVEFGSGADRLDMRSGRVTGNFDQGSGIDIFEMSGGVIDGAVNQGGGEDIFRMSGGQIGSLNQSGDLDEFYMTGGRILGNFNAGDYGEMSGGRIGSVSLVGSSNTFLMSGGTIDDNLTAMGGRGDVNTLTISDGEIGGRIGTNNAHDHVTITGGSVAGNITLEDNSDRFIWNGGGTLGGSVELEAEDDQAELTNLNLALTSGPTLLSGGTGTDSLTLTDVDWTGAARITEWESITLSGATLLDLGGEALVLGDAGTQTGSLEITPTSVISGAGSASGSISSFVSSSLAQVNNRGRLTMQDGIAGDRITITGNYTGHDAVLSLDTVLAGDDAASDMLVVDRGAADGSTTLAIVNAGGTGAATLSNGIKVVDTTNGATTTAGAFAIPAPLTAGAFEYRLFRGGLTSGSEEMWYLRSTMMTPPEPAPTPADPTPSPIPAPQPAPTPAAGREIALPTAAATPPNGGAAPLAPVAASTLAALTPQSPPPPAMAEAEVVPIIRPEVPLHAAVPPLAQVLGQATLATFHERRGEEDHLEKGMAANSWLRIFGEHIDTRWDGIVALGFEGNLYGVQIGQDMVGREWSNGHETHFGLIAGYSRLTGDLSGSALGWSGLEVGTADLSLITVGGSLAHMAASGWYVDGVALFGWLDGTTGSYRDTGIEVEGETILLSAEAGMRFALNDRWNLHPNAQLAWQHVSLDPAHDGLAGVNFEDMAGFTARAGLRLEGELGEQQVLRPVLTADLTHSFGEESAIWLGDNRVTTDPDNTTLEFGAGFTAQLNPNIRLHGEGHYAFDIAGAEQTSLGGTLGLTVNW